MKLEGAHLVKKVLIILLVLGVLLGMSACGGVKYPTDKQVLEDIRENVDYPIYINGSSVYVKEQDFAGGYILDTAISFEAAEKPKSKDGQAYIRGVLTLEEAGQADVHVRYDIFDDGTCAFVSVWVAS